MLTIFIKLVFAMLSENENVPRYEIHFIFDTKWTLKEDRVAVITLHRR